MGASVVLVLAPCDVSLELCVDELGAVVEGGLVNRLRTEFSHVGMAHRLEVFKKFITSTSVASPLLEHGG